MFLKAANIDTFSRGSGIPASRLKLIRDGATTTGHEPYKIATEMNKTLYGFDVLCRHSNISLTYLRSFYWRKSLIYGFRLILTQKFPLKSMVFF
jgi:hypothetical protein